MKACVWSLAFCGHKGEDNISTLKNFDIGCDLLVICMLALNQTCTSAIRSALSTVLSAQQMFAFTIRPWGWVGGYIHV